MKQWKKFVGFDMRDRSQIGKETANPGPINNKSLLVGECVCVCARVCVCAGACVCEREGEYLCVFTPCLFV